MTSARRRVRPGQALSLALVLSLAGVLAGCSDDDDSNSSPDRPNDRSEDAPDFERPPQNPFLADSVAPIGHIDSAQSDSTAVAGPVGPTGTLTDEDLQYTHLGPGHFGLAISPEYPDGSRVIWSNGGDRISKLDADSLEVLAELPIPGKTLMRPQEADDAIATLDAQKGDELAATSLTLTAQYLTGLAGVYYLLDRDNTLFVGGAESIIAYRDADPDDPGSPIEVRDEWRKPAEVGGVFVGANMTYDGRIVAVTDEGWVVAVTRDFSSYDAVQLVGAEVARQHNLDMVATGRRPGSASWVRNSAAIDDEGGIYVPSLEHMHKVVWDGSRLSTDPADGAWTAEYRNSTGIGSGATPTLMGFGDEDRFVVITDGDTLMNVVLFWRDDVPDGWEQLADAPSERIAGQLPADMDDPALDAIQSEQSVVVAGYGALVVNNEPATVPDGYPPAGVRSLVGHAGNDPAFAPHGVQKFAWDPERRELREAWVTTEVSSANSVPIVSAGSDTVYTVGSRDGEWSLEGIDWTTGESRFHWVTGSARYNTLFSGLFVDEEGRVLHTTAFGIVRYR